MTAAHSYREFAPFLIVCGACTRRGEEGAGSERTALNEESELGASSVGVTAHIGDGGDAGRGRRSPEGPGGLLVPRFLVTRIGAR